MVQTNLYRQAVDKFGSDHQHYVTIEEMGEAIAAISQFKNRGRGTEEEVLGELADVIIMMEQMKVIYGEKLVNAVYKKLEKLERHLS